jgi:asparaginyl-tRNA synthetase
VSSNEKDQGLTKISQDLIIKDASKNTETEIQKENLVNFFSRPAYLTASAQLHLETMTTTLGNVYTLSPTFRAEKSMTRHHLAEFYMLEAELIDMSNLDQLLDFAEDFLKKVCLNTLNRAIQSGSTVNQKAHLEFLTNLLSVKKFERISYEEAIQILKKLMTKKKHSNLTKKSIEFGEDLNKEQEKLLVDHFEQTPVFICRYPKEIKPFYMRQSCTDPKLVDNFDLLVPKVGEIIGGSLREYRLDLLTEAIKRHNLDVNAFKL